MKAVNKLTWNISASTQYKWKYCNVTARIWIHLGKISHRRGKYDKKKGTKMTVKPTERPSEFIKDFIMVKLKTLYNTTLV